MAEEIKSNQKNQSTLTEAIELLKDYYVAHSVNAPPSEAMYERTKAFFEKIYIQIKDESDPNLPL